MPDYTVELPEDARYGILMFAEERRRVIEEEGYTPEHDNMHGPHDLIAAGHCYIQQALFDMQGVACDNPPFEWPFEASQWKPSEGDTLKDLRRGVQFLAAAVDCIMTPVED